MLLILLKRFVRKENIAKQVANLANIDSDGGDAE